MFAHESLHLHTGDLRDSELLAALIRDIRPLEIYNLAGKSSVAESWTDPLETVALSGSAVAALLDSAWKLQESMGVPVRFVQASSAEIFGVPAHVPQTERTPISPVSPYGAAKAFGHFLVAAFRARGLHASSSILFNHESPLRPKRFVTRKITSTVARIALGSPEKLMLGSLDISRDWGWAPEYMQALQLMARAAEPGDFVIGTGTMHSIRDFVTLAFAEVGISDWEPLVEVDEDLRRPIDPPAQLADSSKARAELGWQPLVGFEELVSRMVQADLKR